MNKRQSVRDRAAFKRSLRNANIDVQALRVAADHWGTNGYQVGIKAIIREIEADLDAQVDTMIEEPRGETHTPGFYMTTIYPS